MKHKSTKPCNCLFPSLWSHLFFVTKNLGLWKCFSGLALQIPLQEGGRWVLAEAGDVRGGCWWVRDWGMSHTLGNPLKFHLAVLWKMNNAVKCTNVSITIVWGIYKCITTLQPNENVSKITWSCSACSFSKLCEIPVHISEGLMKRSGFLQMTCCR